MVDLVDHIKQKTPGPPRPLLFVFAFFADGVEDATGLFSPLPPFLARSLLVPRFHGSPIRPLLSMVPTRRKTPQKIRMLSLRPSVPYPEFFRP